MMRRECQSSPKKKQDFHVEKDPRPIGDPAGGQEEKKELKKDRAWGKKKGKRRASSLSS